MLFKSKKRFGVIAPVTGRAISLEESGDPAFEKGLVGDGVAIIPVDGAFSCPADGRIIGIADSLHAYSLETPEGIDILVHIGIDTVELKGEGFSPMVKEGDTVAAGDPLCKVDLDLLRLKGLSPCTPVIICNTDDLASVTPVTGDMIGGADTVIEYTVKN